MWSLCPLCRGHASAARAGSHVPTWLWDDIMPVQVVFAAGSQILAAATAWCAESVSC